MSTITREELEKEGFEPTDALQAALPMRVWTLDLEVERMRSVTAAERTVLLLLQAGITEVGSITRAMGMGTDERLAERVLVQLLGAGAIETQGSGFTWTPIGGDWIREGSAATRERVTAEIRLDPVLDTFDWMDSERAVFANKDTWTLELPEVSDDILMRRRPEVGDLLRAQGLPDDEDRAPRERRGPVELRGLTIVSRRVHWRPIRLDPMTHALRGMTRLIGYLGDAENPPLSQLLAGLELRPDRMRVVKRRD